MKGRQRPTDLVRDVAERVALWNEVRSDDFQDQVSRIVSDARESFRDAEGELPRTGTDDLYDALVSMAVVAEASPITVRDACARALEAAEESRTART